MKWRRLVASPAPATYEIEVDPPTPNGQNHRFITVP